MKKEITRQFIEKIVVNSGVGRLSQSANFNDKILPEILSDLASLTGQKPRPRPVKKSIAGFKVREGAVVGVMVTLRGKRMADFLTKLVNVVLPRVRDFRGVPLKAVDANGNLTIGIKEHIVFPEISAETTKVNFGLQATVVPREKKRDSAIEAFRKLGVPFRVETKKK